MNGPIPTNEARRLEALREYQILDTEAEQIFDDLTTLAADICGVPIALVSLVDGSRQWFKSRIGVERKQTPRDMAFCAHTVMSNQPLYVSDAMADDRFAANPLVTGEPHIRFYAGFPLVNPEGHALGALCVIDREPRTLTPKQQEAMRILARQVIASMEMRRVSARLASVLVDVKMLQSLLPICAWCRRIRDENGNYSEVEHYISTHTDTDFTHCICPDCLSKQIQGKQNNP